MLTVEFDLTPINLHFDKLQAGIREAVRPAAQAGAQMLYEEVRRRAEPGTKAHSTKGKKFTFQPGNLQKSIYQAYSAENSVDGVSATYDISWNKTKAFYGHLVEFGTSRTPAKSFIRSGYEAIGQEAAEKVQVVLHGRVKAAL